MKYRFDRKSCPALGSRASRKESLGEVRYQELLTTAGAFFAQAEKNDAEKRKAVIDEIRETMVQYGLTVHDLC